MMISNYFINSRCHQEHFTKKISFAGNGTVLPTISEEDAIMEAGTQFLEDMETILDGTTSMPITALEEYTTKPRACRDLTALMSDRDRMDLLSQQTPRIGLRERLETYLEEEMARVYQEEIAGGRDEAATEKVDQKEGSRANKVTAGGWLTKKYGKDKQATSAATDQKEESPIVWVIEPGYSDKDRTLQFKFSTDVGACLFLKDIEALESIEFMKETSRNTFFQVYAIEGGVSRIIRPDKITEVMKEMLSVAKPSVDEEDTFTTAVKSEQRQKHRPDQRLIRYILRRRWKNLVRRQVGIAVGDASKRARGSLIFFPLLLVWKVLMRRSRAF
jgi:hypothetical protein